MAAPPPFPKWDPSDPNKSLEAMFDWAVAKARNDISWYNAKSRPKRFFSQWIRGLAITFTALGGLGPIIDSVPTRQLLGVEIAIGQWGYVLLAAAAALMVFDKLFGISTGWMRFVVTQLSLQASLDEFKYDWAIIQAERSTASTEKDSSVTEAISRIREFVINIDTIVRQETDMWVAEFQSSISELQKTLKTASTTKQPGAIRVSIDNADEYDSVKVLLDGTQVKTLTGVSETLLDSVPAGKHELTAVGTKDGKETKATAVADVSGGMTIPVVIPLQSPSGSHRDQPQGSGTAPPPPENPQQGTDAPPPPDNPAPPPPAGNAGDTTGNTPPQ